MIRLDHRLATSELIGGHGITSEDWGQAIKLAQDVRAKVQARREAGELGFCELPYEDPSDILEFVRQRRDEYEDFIGVGIGGSALGAIALISALCPPYYNLLPREKRYGPRVFFSDNVDPWELRGLLEVVDPGRALFNIVTKSGGTVETVATFLVVRKLLEEAVGRRWREHVVVTTDPHRGDLREVARREGLPVFHIPPNVGGRFSVLSPVGLLPAAFAGIDVEGLLAGARDMDRRIRTSHPDDDPAYIGAALHWLFYGKGKWIAVMMPYARALREVADWFRQLWAESLGKKYNLKGEVVHIGPTPVRALGTTDQHSQVQLYVEGPPDKFFTFIAVEDYGSDFVFPEYYPDLSAMGYLGGRRMSELIKAEQVATAYALAKAGRPSVTITLPKVDAYHLGELLYMLEMQTAYAGELFGVNAYDQPGVEAGKHAAYALMCRPGYEELREEIEEFLGQEMGKPVSGR